MNKSWVNDLIVAINHNDAMAADSMGLTIEDLNCMEQHIVYNWFKRHFAKGRLSVLSFWGDALYEMAEIMESAEKRTNGN